MASLLEARGVVKLFPGMTALDQVDFTLEKGEVHGLMGENGAGKSTLLKVLTGVQTHEGGELFLEGQPIRPASPFEAAKLGIRCVYQEVNLTPNLSVAENICLGSAAHGRATVSWRSMRATASEVMERLGVPINVSLPLENYSIAIQQLVAIGRAIVETPKVLILDEPTSSLDQKEVEQVFEVIRKLKSEGIGIIFVSHFIDQVYEICDRLTILRNGKKIATGTTQEIDRRTLVEHMIGHKQTDTTHVRDAAPYQGGEVVLKSENLSRKGSVSGVDFTLEKGQVVGLAGLLGSGRSESLDLIFGATQADTGNVTVGQRPSRSWNCRKAIASGIGYCPEDRKVAALVPGLSVRENIMLALQASRGLQSRVPYAEQKRLVDEMIQALQIKTTDIEKPIQFLSGGNQQKCVLARWLIMKPTVLLLDEPTRGVDVGAREEILKVIEGLRQEGMSVVIADSELEELLRLADRIIVLRDRAVSGTLEGEEMNSTNLLSKIASGGNA